MRFKQVFERMRSQSLEKSLFVHTWFQAERQLCACQRGNGMPRLCFSAAACGLFVEECISVVGMNLQREFFSRENKFNEKREVRFGGELAAAPLLRHFRPGRTERFAGKWTGSDAAIDASEPCLAQRLSQIGFFRDKRC